MAANSALRRVMKRLLFPLFHERFYKYFQALAMAWDIRFGSLAEPELQLLPCAIHKGDTVLDIGANFGLYTYHLSQAVGKSGRVYAFEPVPFTYRSLKLVATILHLRNAELIPRGCSDQAGRVRFTVPVQTSGAISAGQAHIGTRQDERKGKEAHVRWEKTKEVEGEVVALDQFLPPLANLSFIKCDIEGAELLAFRGAEKTIDHELPTVLCEINPWFLEGFGLRLEELTGFFFGKGYALYRYDETQRLLKPVTAGQEVVEDNYIFLHPSRRDRLAPLLATTQDK
jgi:FkbM family methyltransferase